MTQLAWLYISLSAIVVIGITGLLLYQKFYDRTHRHIHK